MTSGLKHLAGEIYHNFFPTVGPTRVWLHTYCDKKFDTVELEEYGLAIDIGERPEWFESVGEVGWADILGFSPYNSNDLPDLESWLLQQGLTIGQAFCVEIPTPSFIHDYEYESGITYVETEFDNVTVVNASPVDLDTVVYRWEKFIKLEQELVAKQWEEARQAKALIETDYASMKVYRSVYGNNFEHKVMLVLHSEHASYNQMLAEGKSPNTGKFEEAFENLVANTKIRLPHLTEEMIRGISTKNS